MLCDPANPGEKPDYPYPTLIRAAILGSPRRALTLQGIYDALESRWQWFRDHKDDKGWKVGPASPRRRRDRSSGSSHARSASPRSCRLQREPLAVRQRRGAERRREVVSQHSGLAEPDETRDLVHGRVTALEQLLRAEQALASDPGGRCGAGRVTEAARERPRRLEGTGGKHLDRHEHIGEGAIGRDAMRAILTHSKLKHLPFILETPEVETKISDNIAAVRELSV